MMAFSGVFKYFPHKNYQYVRNTVSSPDVKLDPDWGDRGEIIGYRIISFPCLLVVGPPSLLRNKIGEV